MTDIAAIPTRAPRERDPVSIAAGLAAIGIGGMLAAIEAELINPEPGTVGIVFSLAAAAVLLVAARTPRRQAASGEQPVAVPSGYLTGDPQSPAAPRTEQAPEKMLGGVLLALSERTGIDVALLRVITVVTTIGTGGAVALVYALLWALLPRLRDRTEESGAKRIKAAPRISPSAIGRTELAASAGLITLAGLLVFRELGLWWSDAIAWPLVLAAAGATVLWAQTRSSLDGRPSEAFDGGRELYQGGFGVALVIGAALLFLATNDALGQARDVAIATVVFGVAVSLILAPFLWRLGRNLAEERAERIRSQERAAMSAHLHDSVLQTLAMVQKSAADPRQVTVLARRQERELRSWLAGDAPDPDGSTLAAALTSAAEQVELAHHVEIEVVTTGDRDLDERFGALVPAAREALINAAKFAPDGPISLFAELGGEDGVEVFVRDRGAGFNPSEVGADRHGIRDSIVGRVERAGGEVTIRSEPDYGTEITLRMPAKGGTT